jgi:hypothetical protein
MEGSDFLRVQEKLRGSAAFTLVSNTGPQTVTNS